MNRGSWLGLLLCALSGACYDPFPYDRHDLVDFRIAALAVDDATPRPGGQVAARALVYGGQGLFHDELPQLSWTLGPATASGPEVSLRVPDEEGSWELQLHAMHADGLQEETAVLPLQVSASRAARPAPVAGEVLRYDVPGLNADGQAQDFELERRQALEAEEAHDIAADSAFRLVAQVEGEAQGLRARWMAAGAAGSFLELDELSSDWLPARLELDEDEVQVSERLQAGIYSAVVLLMDGQGANAWAFTDLSVDGRTWMDGEEQASLLEHDGRLFRIETALPQDTSLVYATLVEASSGSGVALSQVEPASMLPLWDPFGLQALDCSWPLPDQQPFQLDWLAEGRCSRPQVVGARLALEVRVLDTLRADKR